MISLFRPRLYTSLIHTESGNAFTNEYPEASDKLLSIPVGRQPIFHVFYKSINMVNTLVHEILSILTEITKINTFFRDHVSYYNTSANNFEDPSKLADFIAVLCSGEPQELQELLESVVIEEKLRKALILLK